MDIFLNELSLNGQYSDLDSFLSTSLTNFIRIMLGIEECGSNLIKVSSLWDRMITKTENLYSVIRMKRKSDEIRRFKIAVDRLLSEPYTEEEFPQADENNFTHLGNDVSKTALAHACNCESNVVASFIPSDFNEDFIQISRGEDGISLRNITEFGSVVDLHWFKKELSMEEYATIKYSRGKLNFTNLIEERGFEIIPVEDQEIFLDAFRKMEALTWEQILVDNGLKYKRYHAELHSSIDRITQKFRVSEKYRCHGYREGNSFFVLAFEIDHSLSDNG